MKILKRTLAPLLVTVLCVGCLSGCRAASSSAAESAEQATPTAAAAETTDAVAEEAAEDFYSLTPDEQIAEFQEMSNQEAYDVVSKSPSSSWCVTAYDRVTPENVKDFVVIYKKGDTTAFNLDWPIYGGYEPETISSIGDLSGIVDVSRIGGDGGYALSYGTNDDGSQYNTAQRSLPVSSSTVTAGKLNVDLYKESADIVTDDSLSDDEKIDRLAGLGFDKDSALNMISDYNNWLGRPEIAGENNIEDGIKTVGRTVEAKYGYYGRTEPWKVSDLELEGGGGQMNTIYSWGTLKSSGLVTDTETEEIN